MSWVKLVLVRGIPGSGKSTIAKMISAGDDWLHYEADMYFVDKQGKYVWDASKIGEAHAWCKSATEQALKLENNVVVSNTFTTIKELRPYFELAKSLSITPTVITANGSFNNVHNVPAETLGKMRNRFQHDISSLFAEFGMQH
jgi:predicted kinase